MSRAKTRREGERGQILVLFTLVLVILMGLAALVIDVGVLRKANQDLWNSLDAGALAGAPELPGDGAAAEAAALRYAAANYPGLDPNTVHVEFRCVIGDRDGNGQPDLADVPSVCNPGSGTIAWRCANGICAAPCDPSVSGVTCNTIVLVANDSIDYHFGRAIGVDSGTTQQVLSAACVGPCGAAPTVPVDLVLIVDRTGSMDATDLNDAKNGAYEVLKIYDPEIQHIAFGILGPSRTASTCTGTSSPALGLPSTTVTGAVTWLPVGLTGVGAPVNERFRNVDGTVNTSSLLYKTIKCMTTSSTGTILSTPVDEARIYLNAQCPEWGHARHHPHDRWRAQRRHVCRRQQRRDPGQERRHRGVHGRVRGRWCRSLRVERRVVRQVRDQGPREHGQRLGRQRLHRGREPRWRPLLLSAQVG